jgi:hypothetical protein
MVKKYFIVGAFFAAIGQCFCGLDEIETKYSNFSMVGKKVSVLYESLSPTTLIRSCFPIFFEIQSAIDLYSEKVEMLCDEVSSQSVSNLRLDDFSGSFFADFKAFVEAIDAFDGSESQIENLRSLAENISVEFNFSESFIPEIFEEILTFMGGARVDIEAREDTNLTDILDDIEFIATCISEETKMYKKLVVAIESIRTAGPSEFSLYPVFIELKELQKKMDFLILSSHRFC